MAQTPFSSRFSHVLQTNYVPTNEELGEIQSVLQEPENRLRALEEQIKKLEAERNKLKGYISLHRMLLSPFRRIPADIWGEIFVHTLPDEPPCRTLKEAPLLLTSICREWREIALNTPRLWNTIDIRLPNFRAASISYETLQSWIQQRKAGVKLWLDRSGALPISFFVTISATYGVLDIARTFADFLELLAVFSRRLRTVRIFSHPTEAPVDEEVWEHLESLTHTDFPVLGEVQASTGLFKSRYTEDGELHVTQAGFGSFLSRLDSIRFIQIHEQPVGPILSLGLQWHSLVDLEISSFHDMSPILPNVVADLSRVCSSLSSLKITVYLANPDDISTLSTSPDPPPVTANFRCLELVTHHDPSSWSEEDVHLQLKSTFQRILAPNLEKLTVLAAQMFVLMSPLEQEPPTTFFHDMIVASNSPITHLSLDEPAMAYPGALSRSLQLMLSLTSLHLTGPPRRNTPTTQTGPARALKVLIRDPSICPQLEEVVINPNSDDVEAIIMLMHERRRIIDLTVNFGTLTDKGGDIVSSARVKDWLKGMRGEGRRVEWRWRVPKFDYNDHDSPRTRQRANVGLDDDEDMVQRQL